MDTSRATNELRGLKKPNSVLVRGDSALTIVKQTGALPAYADENDFVAWLQGMAISALPILIAAAPYAMDDATAEAAGVPINGLYLNGSVLQVRKV